MHEIAQITDQDVILGYTPLLASDDVWEYKYGRDIEYEYRQIPAYLVYLTRKYRLVPHWLLVHTIRENSQVGEDKAIEMINFCLDADMFSVPPCVPTDERAFKLR
jgi:hypothetical protein